MPYVYVPIDITPIIRDMRATASELGITQALQDAHRLMCVPVGERRPDAVRECLRAALAGLGVTVPETPDALDRIIADITR